MGQKYNVKRIKKGLIALRKRLTLSQKKRRLKKIARRKKGK